MLTATKRLLSPSLSLTRSVQLVRLARPASAFASHPTRQHSAFCNHLKMASTADKPKATQDSWQLPTRAPGVEEPSIKVYNSLTRTKASVPSPSANRVGLS